METLIQAKVASGLYHNASEVIREALRLLQDRDEVRKAKLHRLKAALRVGERDIASGRAVTVNNDEELDALFAAL